MRRWSLLFFFLGIHTLQAAEFSAATIRLCGKVSTRSEKGLGVEALLSTRERQRFLIRSIDGVPVVRGLMWVRPDFLESHIESLGGRVDYLDGEIGSFTIPLRSLSQLRDVSSIRYIEIDTPLRQRLDFAGDDVGIDRVHGGMDLPSPFTGAGVVIGILDYGFDYTHPVFRDAGGNLRILSAWDQNATSGFPPLGYRYGSEWKTPADLLIRAHDAPTEGEYKTHGTHVAGIAGGRAADRVGRYWGMAPGAELVFVSLSGGASTIMDGVAYVFDLAGQRGRPVVVNLSLGSHYGPHDGNSLLDRFFDRRVGEGRILVGSAGNEGNDSLHIRHVFSGDTLKTAPVLSENADEGGLVGEVEIWGPPNGAFSVAVGLFDPNTGRLFSRSAFFGSELNRDFQTTVRPPGGGTLTLSGAAVRKNITNDRPNIQIEIQNLTAYPAILLVTAREGEVHLWNLECLPFRDLGRPALLTRGDCDYTVGEIGGTAKRMITVGAYVTKTEYQSINGFTYFLTDEATRLYGLAPFSSRGPTVDGRIKPEITAPGVLVVSAASSRSSKVVPEEVVEKIQDTWPLAAYGGTSMASPMVAGIVALLLEANPRLTPEQIKTLLRQTGRRDVYTGAIPEGGSTLWGFGKVDAWGALRRLSTSVAVFDVAIPVTFGLEPNFPNPFNPFTKIVFSLPWACDIRLDLLDPLGRPVQTLARGSYEPGRHAVLFDGGDLPSGMYLVRLEAGSLRAIRKMLLLR